MGEGKLPLRVLVIEDDDSLAMMLTRALSVEGLFVTHSRDGVEGLAAFEREMPHAVLCDALLPRMNGFEVCKEIRARAQARVGIALMSATFRTLSPRADVHKDSGADVFVAKPFVLSDLRRKVRDLAAAAHAARVPAEERMDAWVQPRTEPAAALVDGAFDGSHMVARTLIEVSRARGSGLLRIEWEGSHLELALLDGILVGARDNLREHQLGERLLREGRVSHEDLKAVNERLAAGERVAEALVSMGLCDASAALSFIEDQVRDRLVRALSWRRGTLAFVADEERAQRLAVDTFDIVALILAYGLDPAREIQASAFVFSRGHETATRTGDFEEVLPLIQELRPDSRLIPLLLSAPATVDELARRAAEDARDLHGLWLAGLVRLSGDPPASERPLPRPAVAAGVDAGVDTEAGERVAAALLRLRGREPWAALGTRPDAGRLELLDALDELLRSVGPDALAGRSLGRRHAAAKELWTLLGELRALIDLAPLEPPRGARRPPVREALAPEQEFLDGQIALTLGDAAGAREAFERATRLRPNDADFNAWLAWAALLAGDDEAYALDLLETAARAAPEAMRPQFFLGLAAERRGDVAVALAHLTEAASRAPGDLEVREAVTRVRALAGAAAVSSG